MMRKIDQIVETPQELSLENIARKRVKKQGERDRER